MSESTKKQAYKYTLQSTTFVGGDNGLGGDYGFICSNGIILYQVPPDDAISIENLYVHLIMLFEVTVDVANRVLRKIGIIDAPVSPTFFPSLVDRLKVYDVNIPATGTTIDKRIDLTSLLKKDDVAYRSLFADASTPDNGYTMIYLGFDDELQNSALIGKVKLWKVDALYTTRGIV